MLLVLLVLVLLLLLMHLLPVCRVCADRVDVGFGVPPAEVRLLLQQRADGGVRGASCLPVRLTAGPHTSPSLS